MSKAKFTKGEWEMFVNKYADCGSIEIESSKGSIICSLDFYNRHTKQEQEANAHLIQAAPEMYELIEALLKCEHERGGSLGADGSFYYKVSEGVFKKAGKLLSQARGEK